MKDLLLEKIRNARVINSPFPHVIIDDFLPNDYFEELSKRLHIEGKVDDRQLIEEALSRNFVPQDFPGCTDSVSKYLRYRRRRAKKRTIYDGLGMVMRLKNDSISSNLDEIFQSQDYVDLVVSKFRLKSSDLHMDSGIQKYFSGYEIAPHPDVKSKAFTWMLNIHKMDSPELGTNLCVFKKEYSFIEKFWEDVDDVDRAWVPWEWTNSVFTHYKPNSLILFAPSNKTLHSVSLDYNHLVDQRTQYYGNLWYNESVVGNKVYLKYDELDLVGKVKSNKAYVKKRNHNV